MRSSGVFATRFCTASPRSLWRWGIVAISLSLAGCGGGPAPDASAPLRLGLFAADAAGSPESLAARYRPVVAYLESALARPIELSVSSDAGDVLAQFEAGRFDAVFHRAFGFPHAQKQTGAIPLVTRLEDRRTTSVFLALATDTRQSLDDFRGARFDFSVRLGSSHVMGRHYLEQQHIDVETFFREVHYSNVATEAIERLQRGQSDLCVVNSDALLRALASGTLQSTDIRIVAETPPHVGQLWFASKTMPADVQMQVRGAFLALSTDDPEQAAALKVLGATAYVPATVDDYRELTELMRRMDFLDVDVRQLP